MDEARREALGLAPLAAELKAIDAIGDRATLSRRPGPARPPRRRDAAREPRRPGRPRLDPLRADSLAGRPRPARPRLLPEDRRRHLRRRARTLRRLPRHACCALAGDKRFAAARPTAVLAPRDADRRGAVDAGRDPRPGEDLQPDRDPEAARGRAGVRLGVLAGRGRLRRPRPRRRHGAGRDRRPAELRRPPRRARSGRRRCRPGRPTAKTRLLATLRALPEQGLRRRPLRLQRHGAARHPREPAALVPRRAAGRRGARREPRPGLRRRLVPAGAQGAAWRRWSAT